MSWKCFLLGHDWNSFVDELHSKRRKFKGSKVFWEDGCVYDIYVCKRCRKVELRVIATDVFHIS